MVETAGRIILTERKKKRQTAATTVCFLLFLKLKWPMNRNNYNPHQSENEATKNYKYYPQEFQSAQKQYGIKMADFLETKDKQLASTILRTLSQGKQGGVNEYKCLYIKLTIVSTNNAYMQ